MPGREHYGIAFDLAAIGQSHPDYPPFAAMRLEGEPHDARAELEALTDGFQPPAK